MSVYRPQRTGERLAQVLPARSSWVRPRPVGDTGWVKGLSAGTGT